MEPHPQRVFLPSYDYLCAMLISFFSYLLLDLETGFVLVFLLLKNNFMDLCSVCWYCSPKAGSLETDL